MIEKLKPEPEQEQEKDEDTLFFVKLNIFEKLMDARFNNFEKLLNVQFTEHEKFEKLMDARFNNFEKLFNIRFTEHEKSEDVKAQSLDIALQLAKEHVSIKMNELNNLRKEVTEGRIVFFTKEMHEISAKQLDTWKDNMESAQKAIDFEMAKWGSRIAFISIITGAIASIGGAFITILLHLIFGGQNIIP
jgi:hypothetical protein